MILSLRYFAARVIDFDRGLALERRGTHLAQLAGEPTMHGEVVVFLLHINGGAETGMGHGEW